MLPRSASKDRKPCAQLRYRIETVTTDNTPLVEKNKARLIAQRSQIMYRTRRRRTIQSGSISNASSFNRFRDGWDINILKPLNVRI